MSGRMIVTHEIPMGSLEKFNAAIQQAVEELLNFQRYYRAKQMEQHAEWFASLPRWQRIFWIMGHGAYLTRVR